MIIKSQYKKAIVHLENCTFCNISKKERKKKARKKLHIYLTIEKNLIFNLVIPAQS